MEPNNPSACGESLILSTLFHWSWMTDRQSEFVRPFCNFLNEFAVIACSILIKFLPNLVQSWNIGCLNHLFLAPTMWSHMPPNQIWVLLCEFTSKAKIIFWISDVLILFSPLTSSQFEDWRPKLNLSRSTIPFWWQSAFAFEEEDGHVPLYLQSSTTDQRGLAGGEGGDMSFHHHRYMTNPFWGASTIDRDW
jgi:hypothetical protein